jgi:hypothetical protein
MDKSYCKKIDDELLVEKYVEGKMTVQERALFEKHLSECQDHAQAVSLEKALHRGISDYARSEIRSHLRRTIRQKESMRFYILRYAAILFFVVITPLMLYYQFYMPRPELEQSFKKADEAIVSSEESIEHQAEPAPVTEERAIRQRKESIRSDKLIDQPRATQPREQGERIKAPQKTAEEAGHIFDEKAQTELELAPAPSISGTQIQGLKSKGRLKDLAGTGLTLNKSQSVDPLEEQMRECILSNRNSLTSTVYSVTYSYRIDSTGAANDIMLILASEQNTPIDSCLKKIIGKWQFSTPMPDSLITRTFNFKIE